MTPLQTRIHKLHALYIALTGLDVRLDMARENDWVIWLRMGGDEAGLPIVIAHIRRGIKENKRNHGALKFRNLIGQPDYYEEDLAEAKAMARNAHHPTPKTDILQATGRPPAEPTRPPRTAGEILEGQKAFEEFRKLKGKL